MSAIDGVTLRVRLAEDVIHHDPDDTDDVIDTKLASVTQHLAARGTPTRVLAPPERTDVER